VLPAGYRYQWEEEMVGAFMESANPGDRPSSRPPVGERLSVLSLAARLRLHGTHTTQRGLVWYQSVQGIALLILLYQALAAMIGVASRVRATALGQIADFNVVVWYPAVGLLWVAVFICFAMGRIGATRLLAVFAGASAVIVSVVIYVVATSHDGAPQPLGVAELARLGWLVVSVVAVFLSPTTAPGRPAVWLAAYAVGSLVLVPMSLGAFASIGLRHPVSDLTDGVPAITIVGMAVAVLLLALGRRSALRWLFALAAFGGGIATVRLLIGADVGAAPLGEVRIGGTTVDLSVLSLGMAIVCLAVGILAVGRIPNVSAPAPGPSAPGDTPVTVGAG
jgi:hypothetical protein